MACVVEVDLARDDAAAPRHVPRELGPLLARSQDGASADLLPLVLDVFPVPASSASADIESRSSSSDGALESGAVVRIEDT
jgi:hypothetical protein